VLEPTPYQPPETTTPIFVDTEHAVREMLTELKSAKEIAVDLEHHDYRTYTGLVCLMQISTRNKDWVVDTLMPWRENLQILNEVFTDPSIIKVFHGSAMDMIWLQRDLGLYVVGLFDTYYACEALNFPGRGLKYLLQRFANFEAQKQYQLADWRSRPLSPELLEYARSDTHYLLYIFDEVRNLLVNYSTPDNNLVDHVLRGSKKEALQVYHRFNYDLDSGRGSHGWFNMFTERQSTFTPQQFAVFRALHHWRDSKAREWDESPNYIIPNKALWTLAEIMPKNMTDLYKENGRNVPRVFHSEEGPQLFHLIVSTQTQSQQDPPVHESIRQNELKYGPRAHNPWRRMPKEEPKKSQLSGVAATLQQLAQNGDLKASSAENGIESTDAEPQATRCAQSSMWGKVIAVEPKQQYDSGTALAALKAVLPMPEVSSDSFRDPTSRDPTQAMSELRVSPAPGTPTTSTIPSAVQSPSTLHDRTHNSRKRKADIAMSEPAGESDAPSVSADTSPAAYGPGQASAAVSAERLQAKQQRKAEKRARKAVEQEKQDELARNMVPFDYSAAESMLEAKAGTPTNVDPKSGKVKNKPMNPFAKALDTGTGARRNRLAAEQSGKSMTFKKS
jgi:exosome complex exonuclease RRP6